MLENKEDVLQAIRKLTNENGYDFINKGGPYPPMEDKKTLYLAVQQRERYDRPSLNFVVTIGPSRFMVNFEGADVPMHCIDLNQMLGVIEDWLINTKS